MARAARLKRGLLALAFRSPFYRWSLGRRGPRHLLLVPPDLWPGDAERGAMLVAGEYRFAGQVVRTEGSPWIALGTSDEFLARLHAFDWLRDLKALGSEPARERARMLIATWLDRHDRWHAIAWRPDVLGERVAAWLSAHDFALAGADDAFRQRLLASLSRQVRHLARIVPGDCRGVGLLAALKGLVYGALALPRGEDRLVLGLDLMREELPEQVLPDGSHVQRNPALQLAALRHLIDLRAVLRAAAPNEAEDIEALQQAIDLTAPALRRLRHGDGGLPLFNGGHEGDPRLIDMALRLAEPRTPAGPALPPHGFVRIAAGRTVVQLDAGPPPPEGHDGRAHAGTLSFELSVGPERLIVNCGAWDGSAGPNADGWRRALRGTAAHSTVTVADTNSSAVLAEGLGRRPERLTVARHEEAGDVMVEASHDGYAGLFGLVHQRLIYLNAGGDDLRGEDSLVPEPETEAAGQPFVARFHLHPSVEAVLGHGGPGVLLRLPSGENWRMRAAGGELAIEESIYCGQGRLRQRSSQLALHGVTEADGAVLKWALQRER